jgi:hypothetical protein
MLNPIHRSWRSGVVALGTGSLISVRLLLDTTASSRSSWKRAAYWPLLVGLVTVVADLSQHHCLR